MAKRQRANGRLTFVLFLTKIRTKTSTFYAGWRWSGFVEPVAACDASPSIPVVIFVSKMIPVQKRDIADTVGKVWRPPAGQSGTKEMDGGNGEDDRRRLGVCGVREGAQRDDYPGHPFAGEQAG